MRTCKCTSPSRDLGRGVQLVLLNFGKGTHLTSQEKRTSLVKTVFTEKRMCTSEFEMSRLLSARDEARACIRFEARIVVQKKAASFLSS